MIILVVDDSGPLCELFATALQQHGHTVVTAGTFVEAHARSLSARPDVVTVDMVMPDGSGVDLVRLLATQTPRPHIVAISGNADLLAAAHDAGANVTLSKPFSLAALVDAVDRLVAS